MTPEEIVQQLKGRGGNGQCPCNINHGDVINSILTGLGQPGAGPGGSSGPTIPTCTAPQKLIQDSTGKWGCGVSGDSGAPLERPPPDPETELCGGSTDGRVWTGTMVNGVCVEDTSTTTVTLERPPQCNFDTQVLQKDSGGKSVCVDITSLCEMYPEPGYHSTEAIGDNTICGGFYACKDNGPWNSKTPVITCKNEMGVFEEASLLGRARYRAITSDGAWVALLDGTMRDASRVCQEIGISPCDYSNYWDGKSLLDMMGDDKGPIQEALNGVVEGGVSLVSDVLAFLSGGVVLIEEQLDKFVEGKLGEFGIDVNLSEGTLGSDVMEEIFSLLFDGSKVQSIDGLVCDYKKDEIIENVVSVLRKTGGIDPLSGSVNDIANAMIQVGMGRFNGTVVSLISSLPVVGNIIAGQINFNGLDAKVCKMGRTGRMQITSTIRWILQKALRPMYGILSVPGSDKFLKDPRFISALITLSLMEVAINFGAKQWDESVIRILKLVRVVLKAGKADKVNVSKLPAIKEYIEAFGKWLEQPLSSTYFVP